MRIKLREPVELDFPAEMPSVLSKMFDFHLNSFGYTVSDLAGMLHLYEHELQSMYGIDIPEIQKPAAPKLRIVQ